MSTATSGKLCCALVVLDSVYSVIKVMSTLTQVEIRWVLGCNKSLIKLQVILGNGNYMQKYNTVHCVSVTGMFHDVF
jgi:hypothetical protein